MYIIDIPLNPVCTQGGALAASTWEYNPDILHMQQRLVQVTSHGEIHIPQILEEVDSPISVARKIHYCYIEAVSHYVYMALTQPPLAWKPCDDMHQLRNLFRWGCPVHNCARELNWQMGA